MGLFKVLLLLSTVAADLLVTSVQSSEGSVNVTSSSADSPPPRQPPPVERSNVAPFKPSMAVVVGVLTTIFSITFLLLLYAKHCKRENINHYYSNHSAAPPSAGVRKNSGVDRTVIESLPVFRFGSLSGEKDGLECAVCLNRFEPSEVLKLLPKCKHAFHVECVDTWLDAHSTCPLCRYRVDPEDILLLDHTSKFLGQNQTFPSPVPAPETAPENQVLESIRRISGRHSSAGERGSVAGGFIQIVFHRPSDSSQNRHNRSDRRSLDSWNTRKKYKTDTVSVGCFERQPHRKDGLLLTSEDRESRRLEHRIIIGDVGGGGGANTRGFHQRWSDVHPSDLLYLRSEMIMSDSRRPSASFSESRPSASRGRSAVIKERSVSEISGLSRFVGNEMAESNQPRQQRRGERWRRGEVVTRWLGWVSQSQSQQQTQPAVRSGESGPVAQLA
ncbi:hypothetical protein NMG60_11003639 [Bertholletia excelsa]